jgi:hypothetical protein
MQLWTIARKVVELEEKYEELHKMIKGGKK